MKSKKIISTLLAFTMAFGTFVTLPEITDGAVSTGIVASAESEHYKTVNGFVLNKDADGTIYVSDYKGKGGNITIPKQVKYIGFEAFEENNTITSVTFPAGTTDYGIGEGAFRYCTNLKTVIIQGDVGIAGTKEGIFDTAFKGCHSLSKVSFTKKDANVSSIGEHAFYCCYNLSSINIPSKTKVIREGAFQNCAKLSSVTIPKGTKIEGSYTFGYMYGTATNDDYYDVHINGKNKLARSVKADGQKSVFWEIYAETYSEASKIARTAFATSDGLWWCGDDEVIYDYCFFHPIKQKKITLTVVKGSAAEIWAKNHKIAYKNGSSNSSDDVLDAPANIDATKTSNSVTLVWDDVKGASAYRVYKYNSKTNKYEKYKDVSSSKCKVTELSANTTYKFKVVALKKVDGAYKEGEYVTISVTTKK